MKFIHKDTCLFFALSLLLLLFPQSLHSENTSQKSEIYLLSTYSRLSTKEGQADETEKIILTHKKVEDITRRENPYEEEKIASESESRKKETLNSRILSMVIVSAISIFLIIVISLQNARKKSIILAGKNQEIERQKKLLQQRNEELIKSQEQLKTANEGKDQFLTILSHDLRNPITAIRGFVELLLKQYDSFPDEKRKMFLQEILDSVERLSLLLTNVLFWTRSQTKGIKNHPQKLNLSKRIDSNISIYSLIARDKGIGMHNNIPVDINIYADKNIFDTIVRNLISNSLKFTNKGGSITFEARSTEKRIILVIKDTGIGMEKDKIKKILQLSTNTSSLGTQKEQGTGLGLTLVQDFVLLLGGEFSIKSDSGEGSEFIINLPVSENS